MPEINNENRKIKKKQVKVIGGEIKKCEWTRHTVFTAK